MSRFADYLRGFGEILNLFPAPADVRIATFEENRIADAKALASDWEAVGDDLWAALRTQDRKAR